MKLAELLPLIPEQTMIELSYLSGSDAMVACSCCDTDSVIDYIREYGCETVVMGLPLSLDDTDSIQTQKVRDFRTMLENKLRSTGLPNVKIVWQDERFSTCEAEEVLIEANMSRQDRKKIIDRQAAIIILQRYLDAQGYTV